MTTIGLAGTWGSKFARKTKVETDFTTTYKTMMSEDQLLSDMRKDMGSSYSRFRKKDNGHEAMIQFRNPEAEAIDAQRALDASRPVIQMPPNRSLSRAPSRTLIRRLHTMDAPPAVGRSGARPAKIRSDVSATGERFDMSGNPRRDSFINRSWMYRDDPALLYMRDGLPEAYMPNDVSLNVGSMNNAVPVGWVHGRRYEFTGGPMSKSGSRKCGVFQDEFK